MDSRNITFSQSFFVRGKTQNSKLSLTCKRKNQLKEIVNNTFSKQNVSSENSEDGQASDKFSRTDSSEMEKFLKKFKITRQTSRAFLKRETGLDVEHDGELKDSSSENEGSDFKEPHCPSSDILYARAVSEKKSERFGDLSESKTIDCYAKAEKSIADVASVSEKNDKLCADKPLISDQPRPETNESSILLCPLCWKSFDCKDAQFIHMKACATKHNVSTKQLLELLELIQKQENERKALGLPLLPCKITRKLKKESIVSSIRPKNALDGNIQLGIALSVSLKEAELQKERDHLLEAGLFDEVKEKGLLPDQDVAENDPVPTAPIFLNVGKKDSNTGKGLPKTRKKNNKFGQGGRVPTLLKRTSEDREKLITEKVAIILVGDEQCNSTTSKGNKENYSTWEIKSKFLRKYLDSEHTWWRMASLSPSFSSKEQFYVSCLSSLISPCKVIVGSKLKHLSQIPGRNSSPGIAPSIKLPNCEKSEEVEINLTGSSSKDSSPNPNLCSKKKDLKRSLFIESTPHAEQNKLSHDWVTMVGNPEMSDVTVYTEGERKIPAHKLVFYARCPAILQELVEEEEIGGLKSTILLWVETCYLAAFEFLKYIYTGIFNENVSMSRETLEHLSLLAEKYVVKDLMEVLKKVYCFKEEDENSMQITHGEVNRNIKFDQNDFTSLINYGEDGSYREKSAIDLLIKGSDVSIGKQLKMCSDPAPFTVNNNEMGSDFCDENIVSSRSSEKSDSVQGVETGLDINNDRIESPVVSPIVSDVGKSSPDIFQDSRMMNSPESVEVLEDKPANSKTIPVAEKLSQDSRESIEYLVSLMEKDSSLHESTEDVPQDHNNVHFVDNRDSLLEQMSASSHISESPSLVKTNRSCGDFIDPITSETSLLKNDAENMIVSSTPVVKEMKIFRKNVTKDELTISVEVKRKHKSLDKSDTTSPNPKKICIEADKDFKDKEGDVLEVVDLTHSGSEPEEVEKKSLNNSNCSTLPPPVCESGMSTPTKYVTPSSPAASPCGAYISNIWDDFDYIPDVHHVEFDEPICASQKGLINKEDKDRSNVKNISVNEKNVADDLPQTASPKVGDTLDNIILIDEEEAEKVKSSPVKSVKGSPEKEEDITEKLLSVSLSKIDESIFWRDENEPKEQGEKSNSSLSCHTPVRTCVNTVDSKDETPKTPVYLKKANVTPLADYSAMKTPLLHKELDRYGIKHLKKNQAKLLLRHIYNELHPVVSDEAGCSRKSSNDAVLEDKEKHPVVKKKGSTENKVANKKKITFESDDLSSEEFSSSEEGSGSNSDFVVMEESIYEPELESPIKSQTLSQKGVSIDIPTAIKNLIENDSDFHRKILLYEPMWLNDIKAALKANGAKFNVNQLMDYLDEQCITFRIAQGNRFKRRRKAKKAFSMSQPCNQRGKQKELISCSQPG